MMLEVIYPTNEKIWITKHTYEVVYKKAHLKPIEITRCIAARTEKGDRYHYHGVFEAPIDAWSIVERGGEKVISCHINRKLNRHFDPSKIAFNDIYEKSKQKGVQP